MSELPPSPKTNFLLRPDGPTRTLKSLPNCARRRPCEVGYLRGVQTLEIAEPGDPTLPFDFNGDEDVLYRPFNGVEKPPEVRSGLRTDRIWLNQCLSAAARTGINRDRSTPRYWLRNNGL